MEEPTPEKYKIEYLTDIEEEYIEMLKLIDKFTKKYNENKRNN